MFDDKFDIIAIGSATRDVLMKAEGFEVRKHEDSPTGVEQCFPLGSKIEIKEIVFASGGGGTNAAVTFARQGYKTACVGVTGNDLIGKEIEAELKDEGIKPIFQLHNDDFSAYSVILVFPDAERTILSYKGEGQHFDVKQVPFDKLRTKWFYIDSLGGHYDLFEALVNHAVKNNIKIACNPGGKELEHGFEKLKPLLSKIDVFITNKEEGAGLVGVPTAGGSADQDEILNRLSQVIKGVIILTDGSKGVLVLADGKKYKAGVPDSPIVERTGAGDAFGSGFTSEYARSEDTIKAIQFATANASSVVTKFGAKAGILKKGDWGPWPLVNVEVL